MLLVLIGAGVIKTKDGVMCTDARMKDARMYFTLSMGSNACLIAFF
jgi:hypothetical protein